MFHNLTVLILPRCRFQFLVLKYPNTLTTIRAGVSIELGRHRKLSKGVVSSIYFGDEESTIASFFLPSLFIIYVL